MNTDLHALIMNMANQLDFDRQCLMNNRSLTHPLADRARAALAAEPEGAPASPAAGLAVRPLLEMVMGIGISTTLGQIHTIQDRIRGWLDANPPGQPVAIEPRGCPLPGACSCVEVPPPAPVPVAERLPEAGDCDDQGKCWLCGKIEGDWRLINPFNSGVPRLAYCFTHWLPHWALPTPPKTQP